jgi:hypothetical protein
VIVPWKDGVASDDSTFDATAEHLTLLLYLRPASRLWDGILCLCAAMAPDHL